MGLHNQEFRDAAAAMADIIIKYTESLKDGTRPPIPDVKPGWSFQELDKYCILNQSFIFNYKFLKDL